MKTDFLKYGPAQKTLVTSFPILQHLNTGGRGNYKEQIEIVEDKKVKDDVVIFKFDKSRQSLSLDEYDDLVSKIVAPDYYASPTEHLLPQTGRKKRVKSCL